jgi:hypothetical protein
VLYLVRVQLNHAVNDALHTTQLLFEVVVRELVLIAFGNGFFQFVFEVLAFF